MSGCTLCGRHGKPYTYRGIEFDGLCPYGGERLCPLCRDARMASEGVNILVVDDRPNIPPYVYNTVRDEGKVMIQVPRELRGIDGRDMAKLPRSARKRARP